MPKISIVIKEPLKENEESQIKFTNPLLKSLRFRYK